MFISLNGWERFQHYKDRDPPWVKLYRDLLTTESWVLGTDVSRLVQVASILLAARYANKIPYRWDLIRRVASLECSEEQFNAAIRHLATNHFLQVQTDTDAASDVLATCNTNSDVLYSEAEQSKEQEEAEQSKTRSVLKVVELVPRGTDGVIPMGNGLTRSAEDLQAEALGAWRDVDGINAEAMHRWIPIAESRGKRLDASARLSLAMWLSKQGSAEIQAQIVEQSVRGSWKNLRGLERETVHGTRKSIDERLAALDPTGEGARELGA